MTDDSGENYSHNLLKMAGVGNWQMMMHNITPWL